RYFDQFQGSNTARGQGYYGRNTTGNVPPGTVVDESITTNKFPNFYLCSHKGQLGTSRIAHYTIVHNTWDALNMDDWQVAMFMLCHLIARSITPVSVPAPVELYEDAFNPDMVQIIDYLRKEQFFI
ncbi:ALG-7 protein, partial [Aphelenchoides avenae]